MLTRTYYEKLVFTANGGLKDAWEEKVKKKPLLMVPKGNQQQEKIEEKANLILKKYCR
jgi:hypothetical protein